jgi:hypothetical protein
VPGQSDLRSLRSCAGGHELGAATTQIFVRVDAGPDALDEELVDLSLRLRNELDEIDGAVVAVAPGSTAPPPGAKSGDPAEWGTLLVSAVTSGALTAVLRTAHAWIARQRGGTVHVRIGDDELVLSGASTADQQRVVEDWLARRALAEAADG